MGKSAVIIDTSLESAEVAAAMQGSAAENGAAEDQTAANEALGEHAFENLTDLQNEEFVFVF